MHQNDTIIALATPSGAGAIAVIRLSGPDAIHLVDAFFKSIHDKKLVHQKTHTEFTNINFLFLSAFSIMD